jgi:hypothetical protein
LEYVVYFSDPNFAMVDDPLVGTKLISWLAMEGQS